MWPGFDSRTRRHMWVEFVVGSRPRSESFSPGSPVFLPPQKSTLLNSNSILIMVLSMRVTSSHVWTLKLYLHFFFYI